MQPKQLWKAGFRFIRIWQNLSFKYILQNIYPKIVTSYCPWCKNNTVNIQNELLGTVWKWLGREPVFLQLTKKSSQICILKSWYILKMCGCYVRYARFKTFRWRPVRRQSFSYSPQDLQTYSMFQSIKLESLHRKWPTYGDSLAHWPTWPNMVQSNVLTWLMNSLNKSSVCKLSEETLFVKTLIPWIREQILWNI